jgi:hypothetical protein
MNQFGIELRLSRGKKPTDNPHSERKMEDLERAYQQSPGYKGLIPPYVVLTQPQGRFSEEGFLGPRLKPFATGGDPNAPRFEVEGWFGFSAWYGLLACAALIAFAKTLSFFLRRDDSYYDLPDDGSGGDRDD